MNIRRFEEKDAYTVSEFIQENIGRHFGKTYSSDENEFFRRKNTPERLIHFSRKGYTIVAEEDMEIIGYCYLEGNRVKRIHTKAGYSDRTVVSALLKKVFEKAKENGYETCFADVTTQSEKYFKRMLAGVPGLTSIIIKKELDGLPVIFCRLEARTEDLLDFLGDY